VDGWPPGVSEEWWDAGLKSLRKAAAEYEKKAGEVLPQERATLARLKAGGVAPGSPTSIPETGPVTFASAAEKQRYIADCEYTIRWYEGVTKARADRDLDYFVSDFSQWDRVGVFGRLTDGPMRWSHFSTAVLAGRLDRLPNAAWVYVPAYSPTVAIQLRNINTALFEEEKPVRCPGVYMVTSLEPYTLTRVSFTAALKE
jgi:hypothetical protein